MSTKELKEYIKLCRENGVTELNLTNLGIHLVLDPSHSPIPKRRKGDKTNQSAPQIDEEFTQEQLLMWSAGGDFGA